MKFGTDVVLEGGKVGGGGFNPVPPPPGYRGDIGGLRFRWSLSRAFKKNPPSFLLAVMRLPILMEHPIGQQEVTIIQSFNSSSRKSLSPFHCTSWDNFLILSCLVLFKSFTFLNTLTINGST